MLITNQIPVHPHGCGERSVAGYFRSFKAGSSPRLWGTLQHRQTIGNQCRFIPTAVGNAPHGGRAGQRQPVHPHGCGERLNPSFKLPTDTGSSPRLWGTRFSHPLKTPCRRFIPTAVGNAIPYREKWDFKTVHPHGCGERLKRQAVRAGMIGSSPRLWGTPMIVAARIGYRRFIPTAVGNAAARL